MNSLKKAFHKERGVKSKDCLGSNNLLSSPLPFSPLPSLLLTPRPNPEDAEYNMILGVGWHGASRSVIIVVHLDARFYEREEGSKLGELTHLLCRVKEERGALKPGHEHAVECRGTWHLQMGVLILMTNNERESEVPSE